VLTQHLSEECYGMNTRARGSKKRTGRHARAVEGQLKRTRKNKKEEEGKRYWRCNKSEHHCTEGALTFNSGQEGVITGAEREDGGGKTSSQPFWTPGSRIVAHSFRFSSRKSGKIVPPQTVKGKRGVFVQSVGKKKWGSKPIEREESGTATSVSAVRSMRQLGPKHSGKTGKRGG